MCRVSIAKTGCIFIAGWFSLGGPLLFRSIFWAQPSTDSINDSLMTFVQNPEPIQRKYIYNTVKDEIVIPMRNNLTEVIVPLRDEATKILAQQCVRARQGGVYIKHFRKASGTALYAVVAGESCKRGIPSYASELPFFNKETFHVLNSTVFVTAMRHPIDRIISMYWFEGRWPRTCGSICEAEKIKNDTNKVANLDEWIEDIHDQTAQEKLKYLKHSACGQWVSVENYYIRQLLGIDRATKNQKKGTNDESGFLNNTLTRSHLHQAKEILASFDLIMIQEQMRSTHSDMIRMFRSIIGATSADSMKEVRKGKERDKHYQPPSQAALDRLGGWNALDIELYEFAVELSARMVNRWVAHEADIQTKFNATESCQKPS
jgi:hypothetical protein